MENSTREKRNLALRLSGYAAAAGTMIALSPKADAQVVWSGTQDITLYYNDWYYLDFNNDGIDDFEFYQKFSSYMLNSFYFSSYSFYYKYQRYATAYILDATSSQTANSWINSSYSGAPERFYPGVKINGSNSYWHHDYYTNYYAMLGEGSGTSFRNAYSASSSLSWTGGNFIGNEGYLGVRFLIDGETHYGWVRAEMSTALNKMNIVDWAYESQPDSAIITGGLDATFTNDAAYNTDTVQVDLEFPFEIYNLDSADFEVTNGAIANITEVTSGIDFKIDIIPAADGEVKVTLPMFAVDNDVNMVVLKESTQFIADKVAPVAVISTGGSSTSNRIKTITVTFNEEVSGLSLADFNVSNGAKSNLQTVTGGTVFSFDVTADAAGQVDIDLAANAVQDLAGNRNIIASGSYEYVPVSVETITAENASIFPNPANGIVNIRLVSDATVTLINSTGQVVMVKEQFKEGELNIGNLNAGIYIVQIAQDGNIIHKKLIID